MGWKWRAASRPILLLVLLLLGPAAAQNARPVVHVVPVTGVIDLGLAPFLARVLTEAAESGRPATVVLDINTLGGRVDAAVAIRDTLLAARVPTIAFVNRRAISAGALIALAANRIAMADGATIGAATPVLSGAPGAEAQPVGEKTVSYVRKEFRATAEARNRPPDLAEAMVDPDVEIEGVIAKGKLLTLTTTEALTLKLADLRADTLPALLRETGLAEAEVIHQSPNWAEEVVRFLTHPVLSSLLIMAGLIGVVTEIRTPGFGLPGIVGAACIGLFFWGHFLVQLAGWEEVLLVVAGLLLLAAEIFVIPGFGLAGILGIAALLAGFGLSLVGAGATPAAIIRALLQVTFAMGLALAGALVLLRILPRLPMGRQLILQHALPTGAAAAPPDAAIRPGTRGRALSVLHPAGVALLDGQRTDVVSDGDFIEAGEALEVTRVDGNRVVVRRATRPQQEE